VVIDSNSLKTSATYRRKQAQRGWTCNFCKKVFVHEKVFLKHKCREKQKSEDIKTPIGQAAYAYYNEWMRAKKHSQQSIETFIQSKYFDSFKRFAENVIKLNIAYPKAFIKLMTRDNHNPMMWHRDEYYSIYLRWADTELSPIKAVEKTVDRLEKICISENVEMPKIFEHLGQRRILEQVRLRVFSPCVLFNSSEFIKVFETFEQNEKCMFENVANPEYWKKVFTENRELRNDIKTFIEELGL
jgi:hypothetical protein